VGCSAPSTPRHQLSFSTTDLCWAGGSGASRYAFGGPSSSAAAAALPPLPPSSDAAAAAADNDPAPAAPSAADAAALAEIHRATTDALAEAHARLELSQQRRRELEEELMSWRRRASGDGGSSGDEAAATAAAAAAAAAETAAAVQQRQQRLQLQAQAASLLQAELDAARRALAASEERAAQATRAASEWQQRFLSERQARRALHEKLQQLRGNIRVAVRVRPCLFSPASSATVSFPPLEGALVLRVGGGESAPSSSTNAREFEFDSVFPPECPQRRVFEAEALPLVRSVADGHSACVLAYGATGGGKTFTMTGGGGGGGGGDDDDDDGRGLNARALRELFRLAREEHEQATEEGGAAEQRRSGWSLDVACYEVYNDAVFDLLPAEEDASQQQQQPRPSLDLCGLPAGELPPGVDRVQGLRWRRVTRPEEVERLLARAAARRATAATGVHARSSRSHAIVTVRITRTRARGGGNGQEQAGAAAPGAAASPRGAALASPLRASMVARAAAAATTTTTTPTPTPRGASARGLAAAAAAAARTPPRPPTPSATAAETHVSWLHLVDLAGSERNDRTGIAPATTLMRESVSINRSLSALQVVVEALQQRQEKQQQRAPQTPPRAPQQQHHHVPYRNSKLTSVLQDALCGSGKVLLVACVAPEPEAAAESLSTLAFAQRAAQVELLAGAGRRW
jgi:hypothetical protein